MKLSCRKNIKRFLLTTWAATSLIYSQSGTVHEEKITPAEEVTFADELNPVEEDISEPEIKFFFALRCQYPGG